MQLFHHIVTILICECLCSSFACCFSSVREIPYSSACCRIRSSFSIVSRLLLERFPVVFPSSPSCRTSQTASAFRTSSTSGIIIVHGCLLISQHEICLSECNRLVIYSNCRFCSSTLSEPQPVSPIAAIEALSITQTAFAFKFSLPSPHAGRNVCSKEFSFYTSEFPGPASIFINAFPIIPFLLIQGNFFFPVHAFHTILWLCEYFTPV